jgi:hypothetical protein
VLAAWGAALALGAPGARAFEAFDGRVQLHGFGEIQTRAISSGYREDLDLVQWYNVLSVELETDILPDGWGPFDLLSSYLRIEGRYDCVWTRGCGTMRSADSYGDRANNLPRRLADARDEDYGGQINTNNETTPPGTPLRNPDGRVSPLGSFETVQNPQCVGFETAGESPDFCYRDPALPSDPPFPSPGNRPTRLVERKRKGFPGFDALGRLQGADAVLGPNGFQPRAFSPTDVVNNPDDDPFSYLFEAVEDFRWTFREKRGPLGGTGRTLIMGPWLPKNFIKSLAVLYDRGNPFRGPRSPLENGLVPTAFGGVVTQNPPRMNQQFSYRWTELDNQTRGAFDPRIAPPLVLPYGFDPVDPRIARDTNGDGIFDFGQALIDLDTNPDGNPQLNFSNPFPNNRFVRSLVNEYDIGALDRRPPFGGDYTGVIPCRTPEATRASAAQVQISRGGEAGCWSNRYVDGQVVPVSAAGTPVNGQNIANVGGRGELPFRPAPDISNLEAFQTAAAQGLYYPSTGLRQELAEVGGEFDNSFYNFRQAERAWNRGQSQYYTKEFKEGYLDMEFLDSRLWVRVGKQNIVWGKTELFRTTDQFNPQDLALASLPSLEESRTALYAIRGVYSFYDVGPLQDVRLELAANFDHITPADIGACGEPFTPDLVCGLTTGLQFHGLTGIGIAGVERPPNPWDDAKGTEFGGRIEFRWDRFSVAISDFYGYNDFPHPEPIHFYERNVDTVSGRPLVAEGLRGSVNSGRCRDTLLPNGRIDPAGVPIFARANQLVYPAGFRGALNAQPGTSGLVVESGDPNQPITPGITPYWNALSPMMGGLGAGTESDCLKPGGTAGGPNANLLNVAGAVDLNGDTVPDPTWSADPSGARPSPQNALEYHSANQQIFSFVCLGTVTIAASVDGSSCAWTIFGSPNNLTGAINSILSETFSTIFAGDPDTEIAGPRGRLLIIVQNQKDETFFPYPIRPTNRDLRDGVMTSLGFYNLDGIPYNPDSTVDLLSLDSVLTAEQRALLGCGPFYGSRCDTSVRDLNVGFPEGGGVDFLNTEASALLQSWPGLEGTSNGWTTTQRGLVQPGTIGFPNDARCTRYAPGDPLSDDTGLIRLRGCRGILQVLTPDLANLPPAAPIDFLFERGYAPETDGCVIGVSDPSNPASRAMGIAGHPVTARRLRSRDDPAFDPNDPVGSAENITADLNLKCGGQGVPNVQGSSTRIGTPGYAGASQYRQFAQTLWHPLADCRTFEQTRSTNGLDRACDFTRRNFEQEFVQGTAQMFSNELAAISWNFLVFLAVSSCDTERGGDVLADPECFDARTTLNAWAFDRCSLAAPQYCRNVKGFFAVAGVQRDTVLAGGRPNFGRRDFTWHSGGELTLEYARRNVFGISADFAEDVTKTNWGMEFTWFSDLPFVNNDNFYNVSDTQLLNLTISVDRPTFINFLNANRTFFLNTQWFFQYVTNYEKGGFTSNGPVNVLFTFAVFTGYYQDRLNPQWVFVYDFGSRSGGVLPTVGYRFTENFSLTIGFNYFFGHPQLKSMPVRGFAPASNRAGADTYKDGVENVLTAIRHRDEVFFRLRYTF